MKEQIYTIPVNEAYETDCECPLCFLERKLEQEAVEYELGAAMMEADHREESNNKGFCNRHFEMMFHSGNKLSLALVLDTALAIRCLLINQALDAVHSAIRIRIFKAVIRKSLLAFFRLQITEKRQQLS